VQTWESVGFTDDEVNRLASVSERVDQLEAAIDEGSEVRLRALVELDDHLSEIVTAPLPLRARVTDALGRVEQEPGISEAARRATRLRSSIDSSARVRGVHRPVDMRHYAVVATCFAILSFGTTVLVHRLTRWMTDNLIERAIVPNRLSALVGLAIAWTLVYVYDGVENQSSPLSWPRSEDLRLFLSSPFRPLVMGLGVLDRVAIWPLNFLFPVGSANLAAAIAAHYDVSASLAFFVTFGIVAMTMLVSFNEAAILV
jgi:hypothetical protein